MKPVLKIALCLVIFTGMAGCRSVPKLVEDQGASEYLNKMYQKVPYTGLNFYISTYELQRDMRVLNEAINGNVELSTAEKKKIQQRVAAYSYTERGYLVFKFKLWQMEKVNQGEFRFEFNDRSGKTMIHDILYVPVEVKVTTYRRSNPALTSTEINYSYLWAIKLKKQLIPENYQTGIYKFTIVYPDNSKAVYDIKI